jgi:hypothetical protein
MQHHARNAFRSPSLATVAPMSQLAAAPAAATSPLQSWQALARTRSLCGSASRSHAARRYCIQSRAAPPPSPAFVWSLLWLRSTGQPVICSELTESCYCGNVKYRRKCNKITSSGTIPKCSSVGVYSTAVAAASSMPFVSCENDGSSRTCNAGKTCGASVFTHLLARPARVQAAAAPRTMCESTT